MQMTPLVARLTIMYINSAGALRFMHRLVCTHRNDVENKIKGKMAA